MESILGKPKDGNADWKNKVRLEQGMKPLPVAAYTLVEPFTDLLWVWNGFWRLSNVRPIGFNGVLRIPIAEIEAYCRLHSYDYGRRTEFLFYIERLDVKFMEHIEKKREEQERMERTKSNDIGPRKRGVPRSR